MTGLPIVSEDPIHRGDPARLADLLGQAGEAPRWGPDDLSAILAHQLRAPLLFDLHRVSIGRAAPDAAPDPWGEAAARQIRNFGDLLAHPSPPRGLLVMAKNFAKTADASETPALPGEVATVLYFAAIAAATVRLGERITVLDDHAIAAGTAWALAQDWLAPELRPLFAGTLEILGGGPATPESRYE